MALAIGSVSLFADSVDFLEDTSVNFLIAIARGWSATAGHVWAWPSQASCSYQASLRCGRVGEVLVADAACPASPIAGWRRRPGHQYVVRVHAGAIPSA